MTDSEQANMLIMRTAPSRNIKPHGIMFSERCVGYMLEIARRQEQDKHASSTGDISYQLIVELPTRLGNMKHILTTCDTIEQAQKALKTARTDHTKAKAFYIIEVSERVVQSIVIGE